MAKVFIINEPPQELDFTAAEEHGELVVVFPRSIRSTARMADAAVRRAEMILSEFTDKDYLLFCGGDPTSFGIVMTIAALNTRGAVKTLVWERPYNDKPGHYTVASFNFED
jgi:hypothetical protein